ncbi:serine/threonine-protein kinase [Streptomyces sp. TLI_146]|uniref:serine/threonine-protein kinase n=1 Tax=Streptomyces sp. TLI_146 TaxID=1938858 RepID=UPI000CB6D157|nr:serine/threonine-protein kinase [Streptomyces sp. TLI_146]PKV86570.1 protein kinase-like protein [Streptomyces sp. TLI_146]
MEDLAAGDPSHIGPFRLLGRLGAGGMGRVYLARSAGGRTVAVKLVREPYAHRSEFRARFAREVAAARRVGGEWTAHVLDADVDAEIPWVATAYVAGPSLQDVVGRDFGPLPEPSLLVLANRLALALEAVHGAGLVHRDLKPSNVLLAVDGPRLIDFGITRALDAMEETALTDTGVVLGSPGFMSPEQLRGERVTEASDVFCLGAVLAYAATGRPPFEMPDGGLAGLMFRIAYEEPDLTGVPAALLPLVRDCLHKDPDRRPAPRLIAVRTAGDLPAHGWLPAGLLAQLARHSAQLLDADIPRTTVRAPAYRPPVPEHVNLRNDAPPRPGTAESAAPYGPALRRRRRRATLAALGALGAVLLAALGWSVKLALDDGSGDSPGGSNSPNSSASTPFSFDGAWEGSMKSYRIRLVVAEEGSGDKSRITLLDDHRMCGGLMTVASRTPGKVELTSADTREKEIDAYGEEAKACPVLPPQTLQPGMDGYLAWSAGSDYIAALTRAADGPSAVPAQYLGTWKAKVPTAASTYTATIAQGRIGGRLARLERVTSGRTCVWTALLVKANSYRLTLAPYEPISTGTGAGCSNGFVHEYVFVGDGTLKLHYPDGEGIDVTFTR